MAEAPRELLRYSIVDRLSAATRSHGAGDLRTGMHELKEKVRRDLEWLLNSRRVVGPEVEALTEVRRSILDYGLPDFSSLSHRSGADQRRIAAAIVETLRKYEPRLLSIQVETVAAGKADDFRLRYRIDAVLHVEPFREPISFDTFLEPQTGGFQVEVT